MTEEMQLQAIANHDADPGHSYEQHYQRLMALEDVKKNPLPRTAETMEDIDRLAMHMSATEMMPYQVAYQIVISRPPSAAEPEPAPAAEPSLQERLDDAGRLVARADAFVLRQEAQRLRAVADASEEDLGAAKKVLRLVEEKRAAVALVAPSSFIDAVKCIAGVDREPYTTEQRAAKRLLATLTPAAARKETGALFDALIDAGNACKGAGAFSESQCQQIRTAADALASRFDRRSAA